MRLPCFQSPISQSNRTNSLVDEFTCIQPSRTRKIQHRLGAALGKGDRTPAGDGGKQGERIQSCSIRPEIPPAILQAIRRQRIADPRRTRAIQALPPAVSTIPAREKMKSTAVTIANSKPQTHSSRCRAAGTATRFEGRLHSQGGLPSLSPFPLAILSI